jgi:uncharacterized protein YabN with tetrapyrrole methylase and pyrophosphatase domain
VALAARLEARRQGSLTIVGTGIRLAAQATPEAVAHIKGADKLLYLLADPAAKVWIQSLNRTAESLAGCYAEGKPRMSSYQEMVERMLGHLRRQVRVCVAFYGHPGVFVYPSHEAIRRARAEGFPARMLPAVSAEDCMFADLGIDPAQGGCQSFEATDFLNCRRPFSPKTALILWQVGVIGESSVRTSMEPNRRALRALTARLLRYYPGTHEVIIYEANPYAIYEPTVARVALSGLSRADVPPMATLYVPSRLPKGPRRD